MKEQRENFKEYLTQNKRRLLRTRDKNIERINEAVNIASEFFETTREELFKRNRKRHLVEKRQMIFLWLIGKSFKSVDVGRAINMDHSSVLYGAETMFDLTEKYEGIKHRYDELDSHLKIKKIKKSLR